MKISVVPACDGSKRIPFKKIKDFRGKPMFAYDRQDIKMRDFHSELAICQEAERYYYYVDVISLPIYPGLTDLEQDKVIEAMRGCL